MISRRSFLWGGTVALFASTGATRLAYARAIRAAHRRIDGTHSNLIESRQGALEFAEMGSGAPILFLHGTGGGFDHGLSRGAPLASLGYRLIAPSRFGYLRSAMPENSGPQAQADALVDLLDHLGLGRVAVAGGSAGAIPAIAFAIRYPERTAALLPIVPAVYAPGRAKVAPWGPVQRWLAEAALGSDFIFWATITAAPDTMIGALLATDPEVVHAANAAEQARAREVLHNILPISARTRGLLMDVAATGGQIAFDYRAITAPTLAISLEDDRFLTAESARHIAAQIPGARAIIYPDGGHIWMGRNAEIFAAIAAFLTEIGYR